MVVHQHRSSHGCRVAVNCPAHRSTMTPPQSRKVNWWLKICHASINWPCTVVMRAIFHEHPYRPMSPLNWHVSKIFIVSEHIRYIRESLSFCFVFVRVTEFETNKKCFSLSHTHSASVIGRDHVQQSAIVGRTKLRYWMSVGGLTATGTHHLVDQWHWIQGTFQNGEYEPQTKKKCIQKSTVADWHPESLFCSRPN